MSGSAGSRPPRHHHAIQRFDRLVERLPERTRAILPGIIRSRPTRTRIPLRPNALQSRPLSNRPCRVPGGGTAPSRNRTPERSPGNATQRPNARDGTRAARLAPVLPLPLPLQPPCAPPPRALTYNQMVVRSDLTDAEVDRLFRALADATRRDIVARVLAGEPASVSALAARYEMSFAAVQKHVAVLEGAGLVTKETQGRERLVRGNPERLARARDLLAQLERLWRERFSQLDRVLAEPPTRE